MIDSMIIGNMSAQIWVDETTEPHACLVWDQSHDIMLGGNAASAALQPELSEVIADVLLPHFKQHHTNFFKLYTTHEGWNAQIERLFADVKLKQYPRVQLIYDQPSVSDWRSAVPDGFTLQPITQSLLEDSSLGHVEGLNAEINLMWLSRDLFLANGFGYCVVNQEKNELVCWCTAEYVSVGKCGIGIETQEAYMNRGFARLTASAFVAHCLTHNIRPHWESWVKNFPSVAVAKRVGFREKPQFSIFVGEIDRNP